MTNRGNTTLLITRHGLVDNPSGLIYVRHRDIPLSREGHRQMQQVGKTIKARSFKPKKIYSSTLTRAIQSSKEIAKSFPGIEIIPVADLQDVHAPNLIKNTIAWLHEMESQGIDLYEHPDYVGDMESKQDIAKRMKKVLDKIISDNQGQTVIVLSHGDPIAFLKSAMKNGEKVIPSTSHLKKHGFYPQKGDIWCIKLSPQGKILKESTL